MLHGYRRFLGHESRHVHTGLCQHPFVQTYHSFYMSTIQGQKQSLTYDVFSFAGDQSRNEANVEGFFGVEAAACESQLSSQRIIASLYTGQIQGELNESLLGRLDAAEGRNDLLRKALESAYIGRQPHVDLCNRKDC